jgi:hypothetical protein
VENADVFIRQIEWKAFENFGFLIAIKPAFKLGSRYAMEFLMKFWEVREI